MSAPIVPGRATCSLGRTRRLRAALAACALTVFICAKVLAVVPPPPDLDARAGFDQRIGATLPMEAPLSDADGRPTSLATIADGRPVLLAFGYYRCPNLCDLTLHAIASATAKVSLRVGRDYAVAFVSIATDETPADARDARDMLLRMSPQGEVDRWHWMTAAAPSIASARDVNGNACLKLEARFRNARKYGSYSRWACCDVGATWNAAAPAPTRASAGSWPYSAQRRR